MEVSGRDDIRRRSQRRARYDAGIDSGDGRDKTGVLSAMGMAVEKIANPVVNTVWHLQLRELGHQRRVPDRVKRLRKFKREDVYEVILGQHCAHGVQHRHVGRRRRARRPERELIESRTAAAAPDRRDVSLEHVRQDRPDRNRPEVTRLRRHSYLGYGRYHSRFPLARHDTRDD